MARVFIADGREHPDPDPSMSIEKVRDMMAEFLPDLVGATWTETKREDDTIIDFQRRVGTKGTKYLVRRNLLEWAIVDDAADETAAVQAAIDQDEWEVSDERYEAEVTAEGEVAQDDPLFPLGQVVLHHRMGPGLDHGPAA